MHDSSIDYVEDLLNKLQYCDMLDVQVNGNLLWRIRGETRLSDPIPTCQWVRWSSQIDKGE